MMKKPHSRPPAQMFGTITSMAWHKFKRFTTLGTMQLDLTCPLPRRLASANLHNPKTLQRTTLNTHLPRANSRRGSGVGEREYDSAAFLPSAAKKSATNFISTTGRGPKEAGRLPA